MWKPEYDSMYAWNKIGNTFICRVPDAAEWDQQLRTVLMRCGGSAVKKSHLASSENGFRVLYTIPVFLSYIRNFFQFWLAPSAVMQSTFKPDPSRIRTASHAIGKIVSAVTLWVANWAKGNSNLKGNSLTTSTSTCCNWWMVSFLSKFH